MKKVATAAKRESIILVATRRRCADAGNSRFKPPYIEYI